jgi:hypothetical protein
MLPQNGGSPMLYAILAYHDEALIQTWTPEDDKAVMEGLYEVHHRSTLKDRFGPAARLDGTQTAVTLRGPGKGTVIDGPFAETKEQLLGLYIIDCPSRDAAIETARALRSANPTAVYEIRPIVTYLSGMSPSGGAAA